MDIKEKKKSRFQFLKKLYEISEGNQSCSVDGSVIGKELGFENNETSNIYQYLIGEGLVEPMGAGLRVVITHAGVVEVEEALSNPDKPTEHFLPVNQIIIGSMVNSVIQQGSPGATQNVENKIKQTIPDLKQFIEELKSAVEKLNLSTEAKQEMMAEIKTVDSQVSSPKPKSIIIRESLQTIRNLLEGVASEAMAPMFIQKVSLLLSMFPS